MKHLMDFYFSLFLGVLESFGYAQHLAILSKFRLSIYLIVRLSGVEATLTLTLNCFITFC